jgi:hypothetical protein
MAILSDVLRIEVRRLQLEIFEQLPLGVIHRVLKQ